MKRRAGGNGFERRVAPAEVRIERRANGTPRIVGHAIVFNRRSVDLGGFIEVIKPGATRKALEISDIRSLWNHNSDIVLGRTKSGTHRVREDARGLWTETDPPETQGGRDAVVSIERGDVSQMSFAFRVAKNGDKWEQLDDGMLLRTIVEFEELFDTSPVTYAAYPDTDVALRTMEQIRRGRIHVARVSSPSPEARVQIERMRQQLTRDMREIDGALTRLEQLPVPTPRRQSKDAPRAPRSYEWRLARQRAGGLALRLAYHEAGHAVAAYLLGGGIKRVRFVWKRKGWQEEVVIVGGRCRVRRVNRLTAVFYMAGDAAERLAGLHEDRHGNPWHRNQDHIYAYEQLEKSGQWVHPQSKTRALHEAMGLLGPYWHSVRALALELLERIEIPGRDAERIIREHVDPSMRAHFERIQVAYRASAG